MVPNSIKKIQKPLKTYHPIFLNRTIRSIVSPYDTLITTKYKSSI